MFRRFILLTCIIYVSLSLPATAKEPQDVTEKLSYAAGYQMGEHFRRQKLEVKTDMVMQGFQAAIRNEKPIMTKGEMRLILQDPKMALFEERQTFRERDRQKGKDFLLANAKKDGVVVLPSGVQYKVIQAGEGRQPTPEDTVLAHYRGENLEGYAFVNTYGDGEPDEFEVELMLPGLAEALQIMREGAEWIIYIPDDMAYGEQGSLANKTLVYHVELLKVTAKD